MAHIDTLPTAMFLTQNAPPSGFGEVNFDPIDANLTDLEGWAYRITGSFSGEFVESGEPASGDFEINVWSNELGEARRVTLQVRGAALSPDAAGRSLEGVRLSNDYYTVDTNGVCTAGGESASIIADLSAGQIIGGVRGAQPNGFRQDMAGIPTWNYVFEAGDARLPAIHRDADSTVSITPELWIAPDYNAVMSYDLRLVVENVRILWAEQPVTGTLKMHYELDPNALQTLPNISIPNGC
ncbi:hypothetical protein [Aggregatilinea lenta]|uniref:hypothetical protein n=1 Tax=Aggregatilinea lenta TaxID=913108 RepID=UPI0013C3737C|nr:hypothetical protein [Aggregatilinea lenta]